jgi:hypothetical protein
MADFPITIESQDQLDELFKDRLERAKKSWERESGLPAIEAERDQERQRADRAERQALERLIRRDARDVLASMGVKGDAAQATILRLADFSKVQAGDDSEPNRKQITDAIKAVNKDVPAVFPAGAAVEDHAPDVETGEGSEAPLSLEQIQNMGPEEINSRWDRVSAFLRGER